jgi:hypothetical protein
VSLAQLFSLVNEKRQEVGIRDWGVASTTLEEAFIKIAKGGNLAP